MNAHVVIDTGPIVAILSESDEHHEVCIEHLRHIRGPLLTTWPVITEAARLLRAYPLAVGKLLSSFSGQLLKIAPLHEGDLPGIASVLTKYKELKIQLAAASLIHIANREGIETIFTLDRRNFSVLRMSCGRKFRLAP